MEVGEGPIEERHHAEVAGGELVVSEVHEVSDRELAVGAACRVTRPPAQVLAPLLAERPIGVHSDIEVVEQVADPRSEGALERLSFGRGATRRRSLATT